jgi:hypothetical protein
VASPIPPAGGSQGTGQDLASGGRIPVRLFSGVRASAGAGAGGGATASVGATASAAAAAGTG